LPKFIGPYRISKALPETSNYELELPPELTKRHIHKHFHVSRLRPHVKNEDNRFPHRDIITYYDFRTDPKTKWFVDEIIRHRWAGKQLSLQVKWNLGDITWEPLRMCQELQALDNYLALHGVTDPLQLPKRN
jgi:hypothetical protein